MSSGNLSDNDLLNHVLIVEDITQRLSVIRKLRNNVIGNRKRKKVLLANGALTKIVGAWTACTDSQLLCELAIVLGSLTQGVPEAVTELVESGGLSLLLKGLCHDDRNVVKHCLKALRSIYVTGLAPVDMIFQDTLITRQLILLLNHPPPLNECSATILALSCHSQDCQHFLFANGIVSVLHSLLRFQSPKIVSAGLLCLCSIINGNTFTASASVTAVGNDGNDESLLSLLINLISYSSSIHVRLNSAICITRLYQVNAIAPLDSCIRLKVIPGLVLLCKQDAELSIKAKAATVLADLICNSTDLQELTASTDNLLPSLSSFFREKPTNDDELEDKQYTAVYNLLRQCALHLLANICASIEDVRFKAVTHGKVVSYVSDALEDSVPEVKLAAGRCLLSLTRSAKLLRTYLSDAEIWKPIMKMLSSCEEEYVLVSSSLVCNLLLSFCPSREAMVNEGVISSLCKLCSHANPVIQLNAVWALMNCSREAEQEVLREIRSKLSIETILLVFQQQQQRDDSIVMKCLGLLINLLQTPEEADSVMEEYGIALAQSLATLLSSSISDQVCEQALCVLMNASSGNSKHRDRIVESLLVMECISQLLRTNKESAILMATCRVVHNLADPAHTGYTHRQNCLEDVGILIALHKLEISDSGILQDMARQVIELFSTASL